MKYNVIKAYGDYANGHYLHTWDEGIPYLARCRNCGGYILVQESEFHEMDDSYYIDYFPVSGAEDAEKLNHLYNGFQIEQHFTKRYFMMTNMKLHWSLDSKV